MHSVATNHDSRGPDWNRAVFALTVEFTVDDAESNEGFWIGCRRCDWLGLVRSVADRINILAKTTPAAAANNLISWLRDRFWKKTQ
jgi:hypothetical protein